MPYNKFDVEIFDEIAAEMGDDLPEGMERPSGEFEYETAEATFKPDQLREIARLTLETLIEKGAVRFRVRYDGGHDEGFSYPDAVAFADRLVDAQAFADDELRAESFVEKVRAIAQAHARESSTYGNAADMYAKAEDKQVARYALDELAHELASRLLGDGYGTGEYELYGAFNADLKTGQITDDPNVVKPNNME